MAYQFIDAYGSVLTADSSIISGSTQRPILDIGSVLSAFPVSVTPIANQSVSGAVGASIIGAVNINPASVLVLNPVSVLAVTQSGGWSASLVGVIPGSVVAFQGTSPWIANFQNSSIIGINAGSVVVLSQGSVITLNQGSSIIAINAGSVVTINSGSIITVFQSPSIVGTYAEDATHTTADKGLFTLGVRNDAVASFAGANLDYSPQATDSAGRVVVKPFSPEESRIEGYNSVVSTSVTTLVAAAGAGLRNYVTDFFIANTGTTTTLVTFKDGLGSILGYTIAPIGSGSNGTGLATPIRTGVNASFDFQPTNASSILFATVKGFKAP